MALRTALVLGPLNMLLAWKSLTYRSSFQRILLALNVFERTLSTDRIRVLSHDQWRVGAIVIIKILKSTICWNSQ